jgi:hypothetical protein
VTQSFQWSCAPHPSPSGEQRSLGRRSFLVAGAGALAFAACGGGGSSSAKLGSGGSSSPTSTTATRPAWNLAAFNDFESLVPGSPQRLTFGLADKDGVLVATPPVSEMTMSISLDGQPVGTPVTSAKHDSGLSRPYFPLVFTPPSAGVYTVSTTIEGATVERQVQIPTTSKAIQPGQPMVPLDTPTTTDRRGVELLCTRSPACPLHDITLRDALTKGTPVAFLVATPQFCQTAICGPVLDVFLNVRPEFPQVTFLHSEVYPSVAAAQPGAQQTVEAITTYNLFFEPWLLLARPDGSVHRRLDVIFDEVELRDALTQLAA